MSAPDLDSDNYECNHCGEPIEGAVITDDWGHRYCGESCADEDSQDIAERDMERFYGG